MVRTYNTRVIPGRRFYEEGKEYFCLCGCGELILIKTPHKYKGVPNYTKRHRIPNAKFQKEYEEVLLNPPPFCACGCGEHITIKAFYAVIGVAIFIIGHGSKVQNGAKGRKHTDEERAKISEKAQGRVPWNKDKGRFFHLKHLQHFCKDCGREILWSHGYALKGIPEICGGCKTRIRCIGSTPSESSKQKNREAHLGKVSKFKGVKGRYSEETLLVMSEKATNNIINNKNVNPSWKRCKRGHFYSDKNNKELYYSSSYELKAYSILEQLPNVKSYSRCSFYIKYFNPIKNGISRYVPDIAITYADGIEEMIEIKPEKLVGTPINQAKFAVATPYCKERGWKFTVWTEKDLIL